MATTAPVSAASRIPFNGIAQIALCSSFKQMCCNARINKAFAEGTERVIKLTYSIETTHGALGEHEKLVSNLSNTDQFPPPFKDVKDLKNRFARILQFSPDFAIFENLREVVLVARCARLVTINKRSWMGLYSVHLPRHIQIEESLQTLAVQKKIACTDETRERSKVEPSRTGYVVGLEEPISKALGGVCSQYEQLIKWLSLTKNGTIVEKTDQILFVEHTLFSTLDFPFLLFSDQVSTCILEHRKSDFESFISDTVIKLVFTSFNSHVVKGTLTDDKRKELALQLMTKRKDLLLNLLKLAMISLTNEFAKNKDVHPELIQKLRQYPTLTHEDAVKLYKSDISPQLVNQHRTKMWAQSIRLALPDIPEDLPHVLCGGAMHITQVLQLIETSNKAESSDAKSTKSKKNKK